MNIIRIDTSLLPRRHNRVLFTIAALLVLFSATFALTERVLSYNNAGSTPCKWSYSGGTATLYVTYRNDSSLPPTGAYQTAYDNARVDWNGAGTPALFNYQTGPHGHYFVSADFGDTGYYGKALLSCSGSNTRTGSEAWLNEYYLDSEGANFKRSVAAHELGHYIGARYSTVTPAVMVMNTSRNRDTAYLVDEDDECAINDRYPNSSYSVTC